MAYIAGSDRTQVVLLPEVLDDYVTADNPVRFLDAFVEQGVTMEQVPISVSFFGGDIHDTGGAIVLPDQHLVISTGVREERLVRVAGDSVEVIFSMDAAEMREINLPSCGMRFSGMPPVFTPTHR